MKRFLTLRRKRDELGVVAIIAALLAVVLLMFAAYAVDIGMQINKKHQLNDTLDAAAQAGAYDLPGKLEHRQGRRPGLRTGPRPDRDRDAGAQRRLLVRGRLQARLRRPTVDPPRCRRPATRAPPRTPRVSTTRPPAARSAAARCCAPSRAWSPRRTPLRRRSRATRSGSTRDARSTSRSPRPVASSRAPPATSSRWPARAPAARSRPTRWTSPSSPTARAAWVTTDVDKLRRRHQGHAAGDDAEPAVRRPGHHRPQCPDHHRPGRFEGLRLDKAWPDLRQHLRRPPGCGCRSRSPTTTDGTGDAEDQQHPGQGRGMHDANMSAADQGTTPRGPDEGGREVPPGSTPNNLGSLPARTPTPSKVIIFETDGQPNERQPTCRGRALSSGDVFSHPHRHTTPVIATPAGHQRDGRNAEQIPRCQNRRPSPTTRPWPTPSTVGTTPAPT